MPTPLAPLDLSSDSGGAPRSGGSSVGPRGVRATSRSPSTARSPDGFRSPCAAEPARSAFSRDELPAHVDPCADVDSETGQRPGHLALAQREEKLRRRAEWGDLDVRASDFDLAVRVAPNTAGEVVSPGEGERLHVAR